MYGTVGATEPPMMADAGVAPSPTSTDVTAVTDNSVRTRMVLRP
jgi:hypothetical protein